MRNKILSVSVAAYNLGEMIEECINSFVNSAVIDKVEIIITDDGSRDDTPERVKKFADAYPDSVILIRQKNAGPGSTVNSGIAHATGKYFRMVDGDDWVNTENFTEFIGYLENCDDDAVFSDYELFDDSVKKSVGVIKNGIPSRKALNVDECYKGLRREMHAATFRTDIFIKHGITLDNGFYTDTEYLLLPFQHIQTVSYFDKPVYVYRIARVGQSVSAAGLIKNGAQHEKVLNGLLKMFEEHRQEYSYGVKKFIARRIGDMCDMQIKTLMISGDKKMQLPAVKRFVKEIKENHPEVFGYFKKGKKYKLLVYSGYILYPLVVKLVLKSFG